MEYVSNSAQETKDIGVALAKSLRIPAVVAMYGDLGAGKTVFASGIAKGLGIDEMVVSPTFNISLEYTAEDVTLIHYDMYRVNDDTVYETGFFDSISRDDTVVLIEWSENIPESIEDTFVKVYIEKDPFNEDVRRIRIEGEVER